MNLSEIVAHLSGVLTISKSSSKIYCFINVSLPTVTKNTQYSSAAFPAASVALHVTVVFLFSVKVEPDGGSHDTIRSSPPSEAVGSV